MIPSLSENTKAILLLTEPLIIGGVKSEHKLLTPSEYKKLAIKLLELKHQPADFLSNDGRILVEECSAIIDSTRLQGLLERGFLLSQAVDLWRSRSIWVISRSDPGYPSRFKNRFRASAPSIIYGCGDIELLETGGLSVVGPRKASNELTSYAREVGELAAQSGIPIVSGGAKGIDQAALGGAIHSLGYGCEVLAEELAKSSLDPARRDALMSGRLVLISPYDPNSSFNAGHSLQRNKLIYALGDASLVVNSDINKGGTWSGASEQLEKFRFAPVFVRSSGDASLGLDALIKKGALLWPEPKDIESFKYIFKNLSNYEKNSFDLRVSHLQNNDELKKYTIESSPQKNPKIVTASQENDAPLPQEDSINHKELLFEVVRELIIEMIEVPKTIDEISEKLGVRHEQVQDWLTRLSCEKVITINPSNYYILK